MGLSDRFKDLRSKAEQAVVEHKDQIQGTVQKVGEAADQRTGGKYSDRIQKLGDRASSAVEGLQHHPDGSQEPPSAGADATAPETAAAGTASASEQPAEGEPAAGDAQTT
jgi:hypothetical protein